MSKICSSSRTGEFWGGYCPDCMTPESEMCKNRNSNWECPVCNLQISFNKQNDIIILAEIGSGHFVRKHATRLPVSQYHPSQEGSITQDLRV
jgi:hypothetical protein